MSSSTSKQHNGILFDTNVLSIFARAGRLDLLFQVFAIPHQANQLFISPKIKLELAAGLERGTAYIQDVLQLIDDGHLQFVHPQKSDQLFINNLPGKLGAGEAEAIALCHRLNLVFISHDRKATNYCE